MSCVSEFQSLKSGDQISAKIDTAFEKCTDCGADGLVNQKKCHKTVVPFFEMRTSSQILTPQRAPLQIPQGIEARESGQRSRPS
jgi:hypothetical protein